MATVRVLLADDHARVRADIRARLGRVFEIIGAVSDGKQAVDVTLQFDPDVVVLDISMPVVNGLVLVQVPSICCAAQSAWASEGTAATSSAARPKGARAVIRVFLDVMTAS